MIRFFKIKDTIFKIKDLVLVQKNNNIIQLYMTTTSVKLEYDNDEELDKDFKIIEAATASQFYFNEPVEDIINMNYINHAKITTFNDSDWLIVSYNRDVKINLPNTIYLGTEGKVDRDLVLSAIGESDYESFLSLY